MRRQHLVQFQVSDRCSVMQFIFPGGGVEHYRLSISLSVWSRHRHDATKWQLPTCWQGPFCGRLHIQKHLAEEAVWTGITDGQHHVPLLPADLLRHHGVAPWWCRKRGAYEWRKSTVVALGQNRTMAGGRQSAFLVGMDHGFPNRQGRQEALFPLWPIPCATVKKTSHDSDNRLKSSPAFQCLSCFSFSVFSRHHCGHLAEAVSEVTDRPHLKLEALWPPSSHPLLCTAQNQARCCFRAGCSTESNSYPSPHPAQFPLSGDIFGCHNWGYYGHSVRSQRCR